jgi:Beta-lactamase enzyme family
MDGEQRGFQPAQSARHVSERTTLEAMIMHSDNTATDMLFWARLTRSPHSCLAVRRCLRGRPASLLATGQITCAKWTDGKGWQKSQPFNALTLLPEAIISIRWRCRYANFCQLRDTAGKM